jgi:hypothetical protein
MDEITNVSLTCFSGTTKTNFPSALVMVPVVVFLTYTLALSNGIKVSASNTEFLISVCEKIDKPLKNIRRPKTCLKGDGFIIYGLLK